jgi:hypothetical protein
MNELKLDKEARQRWAVEQEQKPFTSWLGMFKFLFTGWK